MNREQYLEYIRLFNNRDYHSLEIYFATDMTVEYYTSFAYPQSPPRTLQGVHEFMAAYKLLHQHVREVLELRDFLVSGNLMASELYTEFHCIMDYPTFALRPLKKGDVAILTNWAIYTMENEKIKRIRVAHHRLHDPATPRF